MKRCIPILGAATLTACISPPALEGAPLSDNVEDWRDEVIYQILTDRFANGDYANDFGVNVRDPSAYHGGDWRGIIDRLDYLATLGITTLWISPVVKNVEADAGFSSYHGYWTQDFTRTNPHFGDFSALREMVDAAHERGIKVVLDIVTNHVGQAFYYDINKNGQADDFFIGQGGPIPAHEVPEGTANDLVRISEWDPEFNRQGVQAWTSLGPSGLAPVEFAHDPALNREPPVPEIFAQPYAYNRKGRVTVWTQPQVCGCASWGCPWDDPCRREQEVEGDFPGGLKDLATSRQDVRDALFDVFRRWIEIGDFDGFRIDTLKHVEHSFWEDFCPRLRAFTRDRGKHNFLMFGEAFDGDDNLLGSYSEGEGVDSVFYFSQYYSVFRGAFLGDGSRTCEIGRQQCRRLGCADDPCDEGGNIAALYASTGKNGGPVEKNGEPLNSQQLVVSFLSNHDVGRLLFFMPETWKTRQKRQVLHQALTFILTMDGIPSLYYGVEQEFSGGNDPGNRETLWDRGFYEQPVWLDHRWQWAQKTYDSDGDGLHDTIWEPYDTGNPTFRHIQTLIAARKEHVALRRGGLKWRYGTTGSGGDDHGLFAFERHHPEQKALLVFNLAADQDSRAEVPVDLPPGSKLVDLLDASYEGTVEACSAPDAQGCANVTLPARSARILLPKT